MSSLVENEIRKLLGFGIRKDLRLLSPSFIPEMAEMTPGTNNLAPFGLNHIFNARIGHHDSAGNYLYTEQDFDLSQYWDNVNGITIPSNKNYLAIYSRRGIAYGYVIASAILPDLVGQGYDDGANVWIGFELGGGEFFGIASWRYVKSTTNRLFARVGGSGLSPYTFQVEQTINLPANYLTGLNAYWVKVNKHQVWFGINDRIRAIFILAKSQTAKILYNNSKPYSISIVPVYVPETQHTLIELGDFKKAGVLVGGTVNLTWDKYRFAEGDPIPPLALPLYVEGQDTTLAGQSISSGSITSHAIPTFGYKEWELLIDASQDFTVQLQYLGLSGNWRTFDNYSSPTGSKRIHLLIDEPMILARAVITPSAYPMTINDALVVMVS
jgi:hypothetical protein